MRDLTIHESEWPLTKQFVISRGARTHAKVLQVSVRQGEVIGRGECVPYSRYGESIASVRRQIETLRNAIERGLDRLGLQQLMPAGAARNAVDCALWDLEARLNLESVAHISGLGQPDSLISAQTLSIDTPDNMAREASHYQTYPLLKIKLDDDLILERVRAVHQQAPSAKLILDANEAWSISTLNQVATSLAAMNVTLIEQPLPAADDQALTDYDGDIPLCADESFHCQDDLASLRDRYQAVNIKLDKTGGLTEAIRCLAEAQRLDFKIMVGCMVGTSLAMAPATFLAQHADYADLDGPALMSDDVSHGFHYHNGQMSALNPKLWGN